MTIASTVSTSTTATSSTASTATSAAEASSSQFLNILLTELKNQNPVDPVSTKDFTTQLAQYSSLEQQINTNSKLDTLITAMTGSSLGNLTPTSYLGNTVDINSPISVVQNGNVSWTYSIPGGVAGTISVTDDTGAVLYTGAADTSDGTHVLSLAGQDTSADGTPLTMTISATNTAGAAISSTIYARVNIDGVDNSGGTTMLEASGYTYKASDVTRIGSKAVTSTTSDSSTNTGTSS